MLWMRRVSSVKQHYAQVLNSDEQMRNRCAEKKYDHGFPGSCWFFVHYSQKTPLISFFADQSVPGTLSVSFPICLHLLSLLQSVLHFIWSHLSFVLVVKEPWNDLAAWVSVSVFYLPLTTCHQRLSSLASAISLVRHHSLCLHRGYSRTNTEIPTLVLTVLLN